jgi:hypothetical protein
MPPGISACEALDYLSTNGLPRESQWRYPQRGSYYDEHRVDFTLLNAPSRMSDILAGLDMPGWFLGCQKWEEFLAIGTWERIWQTTGFRMRWYICVNMVDGRVFRVETDSNYIRLSLESVNEMASHVEESLSPSQRIKLAQAESLVFINSTPQQMMCCFEKYVLFVNGAITTAKDFLEAVSQIDRPASESGAMWYLLVVDYLQQDEY